MTVPGWFDELSTDLAEHGLVPRGVFHPAPADAVPGDAGTLVLAGNAGPAMWDAFAANRPAGPDALDIWSRAVLGSVAAKTGAVALFPFGGPPHLPFQRWAMKAEAVHSSPLGILIHPDYGLWHGYRGALVFKDRLDLPPRDGRPSPCESCADRPCLSACPVDAFSGTGYDVDACAGHLRAPDGADCMAASCRARRACPVGREYTYPPDQAAFHMEAFLRGRGPVPIKKS